MFDDLDENDSKEMDNGGYEENKNFKFGGGFPPAKAHSQNSRTPTKKTQKTEENENEEGGFEINFDDFDNKED